MSDGGLDVPSRAAGAVPRRSSEWNSMAEGVLARALSATDVCAPHSPTSTDASVASHEKGWGIGEPSKAGVVACRGGFTPLERERDTGSLNDSMGF